MSFFKKLFGRSGEPVPWETMPRNGRTLLEQQMEPFQKPGQMQIHRFEVHVTPEEIADNACAWDVPTFYMIESKASCFYKLRSIPKEMATHLADSIAKGKTTLTATFYRHPAYPLAPLLLHVPTPERTVKVEALPDLTVADVRDSLDALLQTGKGMLFLLAGEPVRLIAQGPFQVSSPTDLRQCLDRAASEYKRISPTSLNYRAAAEHYFKTTTL